MQDERLGKEKPVLKRATKIMNSIVGSFCGFFISGYFELDITKAVLVIFGSAFLGVQIAGVTKFEKCFGVNRYQNKGNRIIKNALKDLAEKEAAIRITIDSHGSIFS